MPKHQRQRLDKDDKHPAHKFRIRRLMPKGVPLDHLRHEPLHLINAKSKQIPGLMIHYSSKNNPLIGFVFK